MALGLLCIILIIMAVDIGMLLYLMYKFLRVTRSVKDMNPYSSAQHDVPDSDRQTQTNFQQPSLRTPSYGEGMQCLSSQPKTHKSSSSYPHTHVTTNRTVICTEPFIHQHKGKGDDRIFCGIIAQRYPTIIVADGASGVIAEGSQEVIEGGGDRAAEIIIETTQQYLDHALRSTATVHEVLHHLREVYTVGSTALEKQHIHSATTLLIAFLYDCGTSENKSALWFYAFEGDGAIVLMNPKRRLDGHLVRTELLSPGQKIFTTATVSCRGTTIAPVVGCLLYEPDDILYLASDGMSAVENALIRDKQIYLANHIYGRLRDKQGASHLNQNAVALNSDFSRFQFSDDAVLGLIWTQDTGE